MPNCIVEHAEHADGQPHRMPPFPIPAPAEVYVWGRGEYGRLGLGDRTGSSKLRPQKVRASMHHRTKWEGQGARVFGDCLGGEVGQMGQPSGDWPQGTLCTLSPHPPAPLWEPR